MAPQKRRENKMPLLFNFESNPSALKKGGCQESLEERGGEAIRRGRTGEIFN